MLRSLFALLGLMLLTWTLSAEEGRVPFWKLWSTSKTSAPEDADKKEKAGPAAEVAEPTEQTQRQAQLDWQRRVTACNKLREIGVRLKDQELVRQADELDKRAFEVYIQKTGRIVQTEVEK